MTVLPSSLALTTIADGSNLVAADHRNNYTAIQTAANALVAALNSGVAGQTLLSSGPSAVAWASLGGLYRKTTTKTVNTTTSATDLLNGEVTVGAGVLGTTGAVRLKAWGDRLQNSGGTAALPRFQVVFGGSTLLDTGTPGGLESASVARTHWLLEATILNTATNAQVVSLFLSVGSQGGIAAGTSGFTTGTGIYQNLYTGGTSVMAQASGSGTGAVDTTAAKALVLNVINGSANAAYETKLFGAIVEVL